MTSPTWTLSPRPVRWLLLAALVPFVAVVVARWADPPAATEGDYAHYLLHAKAIAEARPYTDIGYIYSEMNLVGPRVQPPGWPLVLAPFVAAFGTDSPVFKVVVTLLVAAFSLLAAWYFVRRGDTVVGVVIAAVVPVALETQYATSSALSDPLFCVLIWATFLVADGDRTAGWRRVLILTFLTVAALSVRVAGVALPPALLLHAYLRRKDGGARAIVPLAAVLVVGAVVAWLAADSIPFLARTVRDLSRFSVTLVADTYKAALTTAVLYPFASNWANDLYHVVVGVPLVVGAVQFFRTQYRTVLACFVVTYGAVLLLSPVREPRYAWPLYPLLIGWVASGMLWLGNRFAPVRLNVLIPRFVVGFLALASIGAAVQLIQKPPRESLVGDPDTEALFAWVRATSDTTNMRVVFTNPRVLTLETDVPAMGIPASQDANAVLSELNRQHITHVVVPRLHITRFAERRLSTFVSERPAQFPPVFENATHDVRRFVARPESPADSGTFHLQRPQ